MTRRRGLTWALAALLGLAALITIWAVLAEPAPPSLRPTSLADMVLVENDDFGIPLRFGLEPFYIDRFEVTEGAWQDYSAVSGAVDPMEGLEGESRNRDFPMRYVTLDQAEAFARWHLKILPSNYQWEVAMSGPGGSPMPWGAGFLYAANSNEAWEQRGFVGRGVTHVGTFAKGRSAVGCYDMIGNVWEWTSSLYFEALRDRRYRTSPDRDRDEEELRRALDVFQGWPEPYVLPPEYRYLSSSNELDPIEDEGPGLIEYLFALTPQEEFELRKFVATGDQQYVLAAFDSEEVGIEDIVEDPLLFEPIDPRLLFVMTDADAVIVTDNYAEEVDESQYILPTRTYLDAIERELLTPATKFTRRSEDESPLWSLYPLDVVSSEDAERIESEKQRIANRIDLIVDWADRYPLSFWRGRIWKAVSGNASSAGALF